MAFTNIASAGFKSEFQEFFTTALYYGGSQLMALYNPIMINGASDWIRRFNMNDEAQPIDNVGGTTKTSPVEFERRQIIPRAYGDSVLLDDFDLAASGGFNMGQVAQRLADGCGKRNDRIIINGFYKDVMLQDNTYASITPENNYIWFGTNAYCNWLDASGHPYVPVNEMWDPEVAAAPHPWNISAGFTVAKLTSAIEMLRNNHLNTGIGCICSHKTLAQLRSDQRVASSLYNVQPSLATGQMNPYNGCDFFIPIPSDILPKRNISVMKVGNAGAHNLPLDVSVNVTPANAYEIEDVIIFGVGRQHVGTNMPWKMDIDKDPTQYFNQLIQMKGTYDMVREDEQSVVFIECVVPKSSIFSAAGPLPRRSK